MLRGIEMTHLHHKRIQIRSLQIQLILFYFILCLFPEKIKMFLHNDKLHYVTPGTDLIKVGRKAYGANKQGWLNF